MFFVFVFFQWDILCDDAKKYVPLTKTIFYAGKLFGAYFFGWVSDRYGRRMTLLITMLVQFIASLIESFSVNFVMYVVLRVPLGICSGGEISNRKKAEAEMKRECEAFHQKHAIALVTLRYVVVLREI